MALLPVATTINLGQDKTLSLVLSTAEPKSCEAGTFAVADGINWDPANKNTARAYPVFFDGVSWNALY